MCAIDASYFFLVLDGFALPCFRSITSVAMFFACSGNQFQILYTFCLNNTESNLTIEMHVTSMVKHAMNLQSVLIGNATVYDLPSYRRYRLQHWRCWLAPQCMAPECGELSWPIPCLFPECQTSGPCITDSVFLSVSSVLVCSPKPVKEFVLLKKQSKISTEAVKEGLTSLLDVVFFE